MLRKSHNRRVRRSNRRPISRRRKSQIVAALIAGLIGLMLGSHFGYLAKPIGSDRQRYHDKSFTVINVVDGDTLDLDIPDPCRDESYTRVRLWGVDSPETKHPRRGSMYYGPEASAFTARRALDRQVKVMLEPFQHSRDKYNRLVAYVYLADGKMLNEELIAQGYGYADERFAHIFRRRFQELQKQAQREKRGLWQNVQPQQCPQWYRQRHDPTYRSLARAQRP